MAILPKPNPNPCSVLLQQRKNPFSIPTSLSIATSTTKQTSRFTIILTPNRSSHQTDVVLPEYQTLIPSKLKPNSKDDEALERQIESTICRLRTVAERIRELEVEKLVRRFKGPLSNEDRLYVEKSSREIIHKFLDRPLCYLESGCGDIKGKLKDLNLLIRMLEKSCIESQR